MFLAGTAVPDWLAVADRAVRLRPACRALSVRCRSGRGGVGRRESFSTSATTPGFTKAGRLPRPRWSLRQVRDALAGDEGLRPAFLGHLLVELLLDAALIAEAGPRLAEYYQVLDRLDADRIEAAVNRVAPASHAAAGGVHRPFPPRAGLVGLLEDDKLIVRLNQVMRRVRLAPLPAEFALVLPPARRLVAERREGAAGGDPDGEKWALKFFGTLASLSR